MAGDTSDVKVVLFDMDGVLIDSFEAWFEVVNHAARHFDAPPIEREQLAAAFGQGPEDDARTLYPGHSPAAIRAVYDEVMPLQVPRIEVGPESWSVLEELGTKGLGRAVVTNTQTTLARQMLEATGLLPRVDAWAGVGEGLREKPEPDLLLDALDRLGATPAEALMVGDSRYDEEAARGLEIPFVFFDLRAGDASLRERVFSLLP